MPEPKKYVKLPVVIDAMEWDGTYDAAETIRLWVARNGGNVVALSGFPSDGPTLLIATLEGDMKATTGDFIVRGVQGEFYPVKPDIFAATYREMTE